MVERDWGKHREFGFWVGNGEEMRPNKEASGKA